jgi:acylphosphatase
VAVKARQRGAARGVRRVRFEVIGRVQGVGFRQATWLTAERLKIGGWVMNDPTDSHRVIGEAEGDETALQLFLSWLAKGPRLAQVQRVDTEELVPTGETRFGIRS